MTLRPLAGGRPARDATGTGQASFGQVSVVIDDMSYSYGPPGEVAVRPPDEYFRVNLPSGGATGLELDLTDEQKAGLKESYGRYEDRPYDAFSCNCGDPAEDYLRDVYFLPGGTSTPEGLYRQLLPTQPVRTGTVRIPNHGSLHRGERSPGKICWTIRS